MNCSLQKYYAYELIGTGITRDEEKFKIKFRGQILEALVVKFPKELTKISREL